MQKENSTVFWEVKPTVLAVIKSGFLFWFCFIFFFLSGLSFYRRGGPEYSCPEGSQALRELKLRWLWVACHQPAVRVFEGGDSGEDSELMSCPGMDLTRLC